MSDHQSALLGGSYKVDGLLGDEEELHLTVHNGSTPFTFSEVEEIVGLAVAVNGRSDQWRCLAAVHTEGGWGVKLTLERIPLRDLPPDPPKTVEERLAQLTLDVEEMRDDIRKAHRRIDATINIAARDAVERIRKELARVVNRF